MIKLSSLSLEYIRVPVSATEAGVAVDPTGDTVEWAFMTTASTEPGGGDWTSGSWETEGLIYYARILVGPGGDVELTDGKYWAWLKITDNPEIPVRKVGVVTIT